MEKLRTRLASQPHTKAAANQNSCRLNKVGTRRFAQSANTSRVVQLGNELLEERLASSAPLQLLPFLYCWYWSPGVAALAFKRRLLCWIKGQFDAKSSPVDSALMQYIHVYTWVKVTFNLHVPSAICSGNTQLSPLHRMPGNGRLHSTGGP